MAETTTTIVSGQTVFFHEQSDAEMDSALHDTFRRRKDGN